jgi:alanyl-tRNA synthetase
MASKINPLQELKEMEKTVENTKAFVSKHMAAIAFDFSQTYGFPVELFEEMVKERIHNLAEQLAFVINYYEKRN